MKLHTIVVALMMSIGAAYGQEFAANDLESTLDQRGTRELFFLETDNSADGISARSFLDPKRERIELMFGHKSLEDNDRAGNETPLDVSELHRSQALLEIVLADND